MIVKTVKRGFIMRFHPNEFWDEVLYLVPRGAELFDPDAFPYYVDDDNGEPLKEFYGHYAPYDRDCYQTDEPYEDTLKSVEELHRDQKRRMLERQAEEDRLKTKESMLRKMQEGMNKIHRR
jgi:hypothetical protein